ncbi:hypothetical protein [Brumimicrobium aurantiacum]|nr:hypothetical protein [Brumimicrobium aurantiacum]
MSRVVLIFNQIFIESIYNGEEANFGGVMVFGFKTNFMMKSGLKLITTEN